MSGVSGYLLLEDSRRFNGLLFGRVPSELPADNTSPGIGEVVFPMETLIEFENGSVVRETWDGRDRTKVYRFTRPAKVVRAAIDPDFRVPLDVNRLNNSRRIEPNQHVMNKYTLKGFFWMQSLLQLVSLLG